MSLMMEPPIINSYKEFKHITCRNLCSNRRFWFSRWGLHVGRPQYRLPAGFAVSDGWDVECYHPGRRFATRKRDAAASDLRLPANGGRHPPIWNFPENGQGKKKIFTSSNSFIHMRQWWWVPNLEISDCWSDRVQVSHDRHELAGRLQGQSVSFQHNQQFVPPN